VLKPKQAHLSEAIERVVDHHVDEHQYYPLMADKDRLITFVRSNATLIAEKILSSEQTVISPELATFLLAPILIDSSNLQATQRDIDIASSLQDIATDLLPPIFITHF
jgi:exopolyphosphatase